MQSIPQRKIYRLHYKRNRDDTSSGSKRVQMKRKDCITRSTRILLQMWKHTQAVQGVGLENRKLIQSGAGSNPAVSAISDIVIPSFIEMPIFPKDPYFLNTISASSEPNNKNKNNIRS